MTGRVCKTRRAIVDSLFSGLFMNSLSLWSIHAGFAPPFYKSPRPIPATGFKPGSATQVVVGLLVALGSFGLYTYHQPFVSHANSMLGIVAMVQVFFTMLAGLLIKLDVTADEGYDEEVSALGV